jgi:N-acetylglucosamine-6-phosphate deacetylase
VGESAVRGRLLSGGRWLPGTLTFDAATGTIAAIELEPDAPDAAQLPYVAPGLVDLHIHGYGGCDPLDDLGGMARALARAGTTAFQPTLFPAAPERLGEHAERAWHAAGELAADAAGAKGARVVGLHLEGPFVNPERAGALPRGDLCAPSPAALRAILGPATGGGRGVRTLTLAPELAGASDLIAELRRAGVRVSPGHSQATAAVARAAARAGASGATHLFNAMGPLHHREVGLAGFALSSAALFAEIIGDLVHVGADAFELALAARGPEGLCLVSDAMSGAGTGCEVFHWHGRDHVIHGGTAYYPPKRPGDEPQLAGTAMGQLDMVRLLVQRGVLDLAEALTLASATPARALGLEGEAGALTLGARADAIVLEPGTLRLTQVLLGGRPGLP